MGLVRPGYIADLALVDGNPAYNLRFLYSFGALTLDENGEMIYDPSIMNDEELRVHNLFLTDKNKKYAQNAKTGEWGYEFVKKDKDGNPIATPKKSFEDYMASVDDEELSNNFDAYVEDMLSQGLQNQIITEEEFAQQEYNNSPSAEPMLNTDGSPIYETEHFTLNQISEMGQVSDAKNGQKVMDYVTKSVKEYKENPQKCTF